MRRRTLTLLLTLTTALPPSTTHAQDSTDAWRADINSAFYTAHPDPPLDPHLWSTFSPTPGVLADRVTYSTAAGMLVPAIIYYPDPHTTHAPTKLPGIVIVNGHGSDKFGWYAFYSGMLFAKAGAVVLTYDPIGEGERNAQRASMLSPSPHERDVTPPAPLPKDDWGRRVAGAMQVDLDQALLYLASRPEVDTRRLGVAGYSMGAFVAGIAGARLSRYNPNFPNQPHFHALLLSGGGVFDDAPGYFDTNHSICQRAPWVTLRTLLADNARGRDIFYLNAQRGPTLIMNGAGDNVMGIPDRDPAWFDQMRTRLLPDLPPEARANLFTSILYPATVGHRPSWVTRDGVHWLNAQLHFAFWSTDTIIDAQSTTHISTWITANHVAISPSYFREDREGGLLAVGTGIPALTRAQLTVLPDPAWHRLEPQLTYEAWAAKTLAAEQAAVAAVH